MRVFVRHYTQQIIAIELENYESKNIWYRIIPHAAGEYDVWIDGMTGSFNVTSITPEPDPLEELKEDITQAFNIIDGVVAEIIVDGHELGGRVDVLETHSTEVIEQIEYLENEISRLQNTIVYACIATAIIAILGYFLLIKKVR